MAIAICAEMYVGCFCVFLHHLQNLFLHILKVGDICGAFVGQHKFKPLPCVCRTFFGATKHTKQTHLNILFNAPSIPSLSKLSKGTSTPRIRFAIFAYDLALGACV